MALGVGTRLGPYEIVAPLGAGGMGEVYRARDTRLDRDVAIKVLPESFAADPDRIARFEREAKTIAALDHPNIVTIHSLEEADGVHFITMQLVRGRTLAELIPHGGVPLSQLFEIAIPLSDALAAAHERGIVHRDLKPGNVMLTDDGRVKVLDFGLAKLRDAAGATALSQLPTDHLTREGEIVGTVAYMAPEQAEGKAVDHRSDIFSLGTVLYELATGERPFTGETALSVMTAILRDTPPHITRLNPHLPHHLGRIVRRCLEKDPKRRYQSAVDLRNDLADLKDEIDSRQATAPEGVTSRPSATSPPPVKRWSLAALGMAAVGVIGFLIGWTLRDPPADLVPRSAELRQIQLTANPANLPVTGAAISPDGKYLG